MAGPAWQAVEQALDMVRVALAGEQAGAARKVLDFTVDYVKNRFQFGLRVVARRGRAVPVFHPRPRHVHARPAALPQLPKADAGECHDGADREIDAAGEDDGRHHRR